MIAVYSHWEKPYKKYGGGFSSRRHFFSSTAYSALLAGKYFDSVVMYCDREVLPEMVGLGVFDEVIPFFDNMSSIAEKHWAAAKMMVYAAQVEPFLHIDNDVFMFKRPPERIFSGVLVAQSPETDEDFGQNYQRQIDAVERTMVYPKYWIHDWRKLHHELETPMAYNAGILGGTDLDLIKDYALTGIEQVRRFGHQYGDVNTTIEQLYFAMMAYKTMTPVTTIVSSWKDMKGGKEIGYRHYWGGTKRGFDPVTKIPYMDTIHDKLEKERPDVAQYINRITSKQNEHATA